MLAHMFLDSAKIVALTQLLHRQLKPEPSSRYTWWLYSLIKFLYTDLAILYT